MDRAPLLSIARRTKAQKRSSRYKAAVFAKKMWRLSPRLPRAREPAGLCRFRRATMSRLPAFAALAALMFAASIPAQSAPPGAVHNIVLVHGAFVDGSGWEAVARILEHDGYKVSIVQPPETSLDDDIAATNRVLDQQDGPAILVGHSYGGAIITGAGNNPHVKALVYVAAFQPDVGESIGALGASMPAISKGVTPTADGFLFIKPETFRDDFAADLPAAVTARMATSQVFLSVKAAGAAATNPAWKTHPTYAIVATRDHSINPDLERKMYKRSHSITVEIAASHAVYMSQPRAVAAVIEKAAKGAP
jgi:pimeloyl-ACP methyl ester carboxylesterase